MYKLASVMVMLLALRATDAAALDQILGPDWSHHDGDPKIAIDDPETGGREATSVGATFTARVTLSDHLGNPSFYISESGEGGHRMFEFRMPSGLPPVGSRIRVHVVFCVYCDSESTPPNTLVPHAVRIGHVLWCLPGGVGGFLELLSTVLDDPASGQPFQFVIEDESGVDGWWPSPSVFVCARTGAEGCDLDPLSQDRELDSNAVTSVGGGSGGAIVGERGGCGSFVMNADDTHEGAYAWQYGGVVAPNYGAFAEPYSEGAVEVCAGVFDFTSVGGQLDQTMDVYIWSDDGGVPASVLCLRPAVSPGHIAYWPGFTRLTVPLDPCCVDGAFWVGYWGDWPGGGAAWFVGSDLDGPGGCPMTNIAPGIGFPTGWNSVSVAWGPTQALAIGAEVRSCAPVVAVKSSWGRVKALFR